MGALITIEGAEIWMSDYTSGDWIGLLAGRTGEPSRFEVRAISDTELICLSPADFKNTTDTSQEFRQTCDAFILSQLNTRTRQFTEARTLSAKGRICAELKRLSKPIGVDVGRYAIRPIPIFSELAFRAGSTRETVSRLVSDFVRRGIIDRRPGALVISDMKRFDAFIV